MKKLLLTGVAIALISAPAFAADLPVKAPPMVVPEPIYNWTGFYIGGHVGGAWTDQHETELAPGSASFPTGTAFTARHASGAVGGVQAGYNLQFSNVVLGIEGEWSATDVGSTTTTVSTLNGFVSTSSARTKDIESVAGRLGYAVNNWLIYAKGGGAWSQGSSMGTGTLANGTPFDTTTVTAHRTGWVAGAGFEWGFAPAWSAKLEYDHYDFGTTDLTVFSSRGTTSAVASSLRFDVVKAGVNYRFNWGGPVVAKY
jgi:outer membrane immunogenic protein